MEKMIYAILFGVVSLAPLIILVTCDRRRRRKEARTPFTEKLMRPAGESLRIKLEGLNEKLSDDIGFYIMMAIFTPVVFFLAVPLKTPHEFLYLALSLVLLEFLPLYFYGRKILKLRKERNNHELGFQGERAVGEELNQLLAEGCRVYHDLPFEGKLGEAFNIDHVILSSMGVFAIETKTRRKPSHLTGKNKSKIRFDGRTVTMPSGENAFGLEQVQRNALHLSQWLTKAVGKSVSARPVLTFPGWYIHLEGKGEVSVLNPKQIRHLVVQNGHQPIFDQELMGRIKHQLDEKCKNILLD